MIAKVMKMMNQEPRRLNHTILYCLSCGRLANVLNVCTGGSMLIAELICYKGLKNICCSQQVINRYALGDLRLTSSTLYSVNTYSKLEAFFKLANIPLLCKTSNL